MATRCGSPGSAPSSYASERLVGAAIPRPGLRCASKPRKASKGIGFTPGVKLKADLNARGALAKPKAAPTPRAAATVVKAAATKVAAAKAASPKAPAAKAPAKAKSALGQ